MTGLVYKIIGAVPNHLDENNLASSDDLSTARVLLEEYLCCLAISFHEDFHLFRKFASTNKNYKLVEAALSEIENTGVPVPGPSNLPEDSFYYIGEKKFVKVRKIKFSSWKDDKGCTCRAPNPTLLLGKAASNWMRRMEIQLLPAYTETLECAKSQHSTSTSLTSVESEVNFKQPISIPSAIELFFHPYNFGDDDSVLTI